MWAYSLRTQSLMVEKDGGMGSQTLTSLCGDRFKRLNLQKGMPVQRKGKDGWSVDLV